MNETVLTKSEFSKIKTLRPGLKNISLYGVIVEFMNDPPQSTTEVRAYRYHYRLADSSGSIVLAVPHGILQDTTSKLTSCVNVSSGHNSSKIEEYLFSKNPFFDQDSKPGFALKEAQPFLTTTGDQRAVNSDFEEDSDWKGWSEDEEFGGDSLKWLLQPGDLIHVQSALTTWSHGQLVLVPTDSRHNYIRKVGRVPSEFRLEPDMSRQHSTPRD
ncbi:hypothetical protein MACJ_001734 [Theileria orientalis]|uniref:Uncharacterized protein n=1 Tax=Theileria orientalis TaxID=68886 RepID=A0A976MBB8_THEOR|nr:hypothetical protein MACJ_001734 [Theileria orientalis]